MKLYDLIRIKNTGETGQIVEISRNEDGTVSQYLIEKDEQYMDGEHDILWAHPNEIEDMVTRGMHRELEE